MIMACELVHQQAARPRSEAVRSETKTGRCFFKWPPGHAQIRMCGGCDSIAHILIFWGVDVALRLLTVVLS
jgi:hypothetical protein